MRTYHCVVKTQGGYALIRMKAKTAFLAHQQTLDYFKLAEKAGEISPDLHREVILVVHEPILNVAYYKRSKEYVAMNGHDILFRFKK